MNNVTLLAQARRAILWSSRYFNYKSEHWCGYSVFLFCRQKRYQLNMKLLPKNIKYKKYKYFSNCSLMKTDDTDAAGSDNSNAERLRKALDDEEFQNILKDFAKDFGVDSEGSKIKEDIRNQIEEQKHDEKFTLDKTDKILKNNYGSKISHSHSISEKYREYNDSDAVEIKSYEDSQCDALDEQEFSYHIDQELEPHFTYGDLKRGVSGVFDIEELIDVLRKENLVDIVTISIPKKFHYADFLVLATAKSPRHSKAITELIIKLYKRKKNKTDPFIHIEGEKVSNWKAIDIGNIVLHVFLGETRAQYDIESLWLLDPEFDSGGSVARDPMIDIIEEQMAFFNSLQQPQSQELTKDVS